MLFLALVAIVVVAISGAAVVYVHQRQAASAMGSMPVPLTAPSAANTSGNATVAVSSADMYDFSIQSAGARVFKESKALDDRMPTSNTNITNQTGTPVGAAVDPATLLTISDQGQRIAALEKALASEQSVRAAAVTSALNVLGDADKRLVAQDGLLMQRLNDLAASQQQMMSQMQQFQDQVLLTGTQSQPQPQPVQDAAASMASAADQTQTQAQAQTQAWATVDNLVQVVNALNRLARRVGVLEESVSSLGQTKYDKADGVKLSSDVAGLRAGWADVTSSMQLLQDGKFDRSAGLQVQSKVDNTASDYYGFKTQAQDQLRDHGSRIDGLEKQTGGSSASWQDQFATFSGTVNAKVDGVARDVAALSTWKGTTDSAVGTLQQASTGFGDWKAATSTSLTAMNSKVDTLSTSVDSLSKQQATLLSSLQSQGTSTNTNTNSTSATATTAAAAAVTKLQADLASSFSSKSVSVSDTLRMPGQLVWNANGVSLATNDSASKLRVNGADGNQRHAFDGGGGASHSGNVRAGGCVEVGADVAGKEVNAGKMCYGGGLSPSALNIVGAGTPGTARKVRLHDEVQSNRFQVGDSYYMGALGADGLVRFKAANNDAALGMGVRSLAVEGTAAVQGTVATGALTAGGMATFNKGAQVTDGGMSVRGGMSIRGDLFWNGTDIREALGGGMSGGLQGNSPLEFGVGVAGKETDAGKIAYQRLSDGLDVVGAGTSVGGRLVRVHDQLAVKGDARMGGCVEVGSGVADKGADAGKVCYQAQSDGLDIMGASVGSGPVRKVKVWDDLEVQGGLSIASDVRTHQGPWMRVAGSGQLTSAPSTWSGGVHTYDMYAEGTVAVGKNGNFVRFFNQEGENIQQSDARVKENIVSIQRDEADRLRQLMPVTYTRKDDRKGKTRYGFVAQDVQQVYPTLVSTAPNGLLAVNYEEMVPLTVASLQQVHQKMDGLMPEGKQQLCIDGLCITKAELAALKGMLAQRQN